MTAEYDAVSIRTKAPVREAGEQAPKVSSGERTRSPANLRPPTGVRVSARHG